MMTMSINREPHDIVNGCCRKCGKNSFEEGCPFGMEAARLSLEQLRVQQGMSVGFDECVSANCILACSERS
jgi:hypothetical protein